MEHYLISSRNCTIVGKIENDVALKELDKIKTFEPGIAVAFEDMFKASLVLYKIENNDCYWKLK